MRYQDRTRAPHAARSCSPRCAIPPRRSGHGVGAARHSLHRLLHQLTSIAVMCALAGTSAFALNLVLGARIRPVEALFGGLDRMYRAASPQRTGRLRAAARPRRPHPRQPRHDLRRHGARPARAGRGLDGLRRSARVRRDDRGDRADAVRAARARGVRLRPAHVRVRLPRRHLPRVHDRRRERRLRGAEPSTWRCSRRSASPRSSTARCSATCSCGGAGTGSRRSTGSTTRHRDRDGAARPAARASCRASSSSSPSARSRSGEQLHPFELSVERQVFSVRAGEVGNQFHPFSITVRPGEPRLQGHRQGGRATTRARCAGSSPARTPSSRARTAPSRTGTSRAAAGSSGSRAASASRPSSAWPAASADRSGQSTSTSTTASSTSEEAHFLDELRAIAPAATTSASPSSRRDREGFLTASRLAAEHADLGSADVLVCGPPAMIDSLRTQLATRGVPAAHSMPRSSGSRSIGARTALEQALAPRPSGRYDAASLLAGAFGGAGSSRRLRPRTCSRRI